MYYLSGKFTGKHIPYDGDPSPNIIETVPSLNMPVFSGEVLVLLKISSFPCQLA